MLHKLHIRKSGRLPAFVLLMAVISGCTITVNLKVGFDEGTDKAVTQLHKDVESFFVKTKNQAEKSVCAYENHKKFYQDAAVSVSAIEVRAKAFEKNENTIKQVGVLKDSLNDLEKQHKLGCLKDGQISNIRDNFNAAITTILKRELAKKRGDE